MARYRVQTQFVFSGYFDVEADSTSEAKGNVLEHCGMVIGGDIHSTLHDENIDWNFSVHPDKEIKSIHKLKDNDW